MKMTRWFTILAAVGAGAAALGAKEPIPAGARAGSIRARDTAAEAALISKIRGIDEFEMRIGKIASERARDPRVRRYGDRLARDHRLGDRKLMDFVRARDIKAASAPPDREDERVLERLRHAQGKDFDAAFLAGMQHGHHKALALLRSQEPGLADHALRRLIEKLIPILEQHETLAARLQHSTQAKG